MLRIEAVLVALLVAVPSSPAAPPGASRGERLEHSLGQAAMVLDVRVRVVRPEGLSTRLDDIFETGEASSPVRLLLYVSVGDDRHGDSSCPSVARCNPDA